MSSYYFEDQVRPNVAMTPATESIFRASSKSDRDEVDALVLVWDSTDGGAHRSSVLRWLDRAKSFGLQVFVIGSRVDLLSSPELNRLPLTLIEKPADRLFRDQYEAMDWLTEELDMVYAPLSLVRDQFGVASDEMSDLDDQHRLRLLELVKTPSSVQLTDQETTGDLTDEEHDSFLAFLNRPASEPSDWETGRD
jgi:hypothetical protein